MTIDYHAYRDRTRAVQCPLCSVLPGANCINKDGSLRVLGHAMRVSAAKRHGYRKSLERKERMRGIQFTPMATVLPEVRQGEAEIRHYTIDENLAKFSRLRAAINGRPDDAAEAGCFAQLRVAGRLVMADTLMEQRSNWEVCWQARGDVLIAGLGLGMILIPILRKPEVKTVTVIEKSADVIALVEPMIRRKVRGAKTKLTVVHADIFEWRPEKCGRCFDTMYFDIWPDISTANLADMTKLRRAFRRFLRKGGWATCWKQESLRSLERSGRWR